MTTINYLKPPAFFDLTIPERQTSTWTSWPKFKELDRFKYDRHVTSKNPQERIMQTCVWAMTTIDWARSNGPQNPTTIYCMLLQLVPYFRAQEYKLKWKEMSDREYEVWEERMNEADTETQARLRAEKKHELNFDEHARLPYFAVFEVLFGENWRELLKVAMVSVPLSRFPESSREVVLGNCMVFLWEPSGW